MPSQNDLDSLHDAELEAVTIDRVNESLDIAFVRVDGSRVRLQFSGVKVFRTSSLVLQNVAYGASLSSLGDAERPDVQKLVAWACTLDGGRCQTGEPLGFNAEMISSFTDKIVDGSLLLVHVEASWGAEVAVICDAIAWHRF